MCGMKLSKRFEVFSPSGKQNLSTGDGIAIFAFLLFICGWLVGMGVLTELVYDYEEDVKMVWWEGLIWLSLLLSPPFWAVGLIKRIFNPN